MDMQSLGEGLAAAGLKLTNVIGGAVGSFISLNFFEGLSLWQRWTTFVSGWLLGAYLAEPAISLMDLKPQVEIGFAVLISLFGMAVTAQFIKLPWVDIMWAVLAKFGMRRQHDDDRRPPGGPQC